jgi:hypothetical protein
LPARGRWIVTAATRREWRYPIGSKTQLAHLYADEGLPVCGRDYARMATKPLAEASPKRKYKVFRCGACAKTEGGGS